VTLYLGLYLIIEELLLEFGEGIITTVIIQVQRIQHISERRKKNDFYQKLYIQADTIDQCSYTLLFKSFGLVRFFKCF